MQYGIFLIRLVDSGEFLMIRGVKMLNFHRLELDTTLHFIDKFMPEEGHILDAGGGPGRYTLEIAKRGFSVTHLDISPNFVECIRKVMAENNL